MGCRTEPAAVHIAHVLQRLDFFQFFNFFYNLHDLQQKKKITRIYSIKKKLHDYTVFLYTTYIFHELAASMQGPPGIDSIQPQTSQSQAMAPTTSEAPRLG